MNIFKKFKAYLRFREAVRQADNAYTQTNQRHYVLPTPDGMLIIMNRKNFRGLKRKGYIDRRAYVLGLEEGWLYCTPYGNGKRGMDDTTKQMRYKRYLSMLENK
jgi:hypothetical protein